MPVKKPPTWLVGKKVRLRPIEPEDVPMLQRWVNASPAREYLLTRLPYSLRAEQNWAARAGSDPKTPTYVIQTLGGKDIGSIDVIVDEARGSLGIAIWEQAYWGRGYGADALAIMIDGVFRALPLERIELTVDPRNARAIACYEKVGFRREGVLRRYHYVDGAYRDVVLMSVLREEWSRRRGAKP